MALSALDIPIETQDEMFRILSGILHLGNIVFTGTEVSKISNVNGECLMLDNIFNCNILIQIYIIFIF